MTTDFNRKGRKVAFVAVKDTPSYFDILSPKALKLAEEVENSISASSQDKDDKGLAEQALGCFERYRACVLQVARLAKHEENIRAKAPHQSGTALCIRGSEALIDFESLLFHGRSALDRTAFFVAKKIYSQDCDKYSKLSNVLSNFEKQDRRATDILNMVNITLPFFEGVLCDTKSRKKSLRSHIIHKSTASENAIALFTLYFLGNKERIAFDAILGEYSLFGTTQRLIYGLTYFVLNTLSLYIGPGHVLELSNCEPSWHSKMVDYRLHESDKQNAVGFTVWRTYPSGCVLRTVKLRPNVCNEAY